MGGGVERGFWRLRSARAWEGVCGEGAALDVWGGPRAALQPGKSPADVLTSVPGGFRTVFSSVTYRTCVEIIRDVALR